MHIELLTAESDTQRSLIHALLSACDLPTADIASLSAVRFLGVEEKGALHAVIGLELFPGVALLRSLAVREDQRGQGVGRALVSAAEQQALTLGVNDLYLLTMSAKDFFAKLGYSIADRASAPAAIKATQQFSGLCPGAAALMHKRLA